MLNPFYLNYGVLKEEMIGTKSLNSSVMHLTKLSTYAAFGALTGEFVLYGLAVGAAAALASWIGKRALGRISDVQFRRLVIVVMVVSGLLMLWQQRSVLLFWSS